MDNKMIVAFSAGFIILGVLGVAIPNLGIALLIMLGMCLVIVPAMLYFMDN